MNNLTTAQRAKRAGFKNLAEAVESVGRAESTIRLWNKTHPRFVDILFIGAKELERLEGMEMSSNVYGMSKQLNKSQGK